MNKRSDKESLRLCILISAFNESAAIADVVSAALRHCPDVIVVDDGSEDNSAELARNAGAVVIRLDCNCGKGIALSTGFLYASRKGFDTVITLDADGQHDPDEIPLFLNEINETDSDIIVGCRMHDTASMPRIRNFSNTVTSGIISWLAGQRIADSQSGYRLIKTDVWNALKLRTSRYDTESEMLIKASRKGYEISEIDISTIYGNESSTINPAKDALRFLRLVLLNIFPLR